MVGFRDLADDIVRFIVSELHGNFDPVWEFEQDYIDVVLEVENMLNEQVRQIPEIDSMVDRSKRKG